MSDLDRLRFYRDEIRHEFGLLSMRSTMLITCQSFLIVPFAILHTAADILWVLPPLVMVSVLGYKVAGWLQGPIGAADATIATWLRKQRELFASEAGAALEALAIDRDRIAHVAEDLARDTIHERSMGFSRKAPAAFMTFWRVAWVWLAVRLGLRLYFGV